MRARTTARKGAIAGCAYFPFRRRSRFQCIGQQRFLSGEKAMFVTIDVANTAVFEHRRSQIHSNCRSVEAISDTASSSMRDVEGWESLDFLSVAGELNYGHNDPNLRSALTEYLLRDHTSHCCASTEQQRSVPL
jgi:4-aminobutyrate aminotransferase-like enzyme